MKQVSVLRGAANHAASFDPNVRITYFKVREKRDYACKCEAMEGIKGIEGTKGTKGIEGIEGIEG